MRSDHDRLINLLGAFLLDSGDALRDALKGAVGAGGSTPAAVLVLDTWPDRSVDFLSGVLGISHSGAVRLVDRLEREGLVERRPGPDGRTSALRLSRRGVRIATDARARRHRRLAELVAPLTARQKSALSEALEAMLEGRARDRVEARRACRACDHTGCVGPECPVSRSVAVG